MPTHDNIPDGAYTKKYYVAQVGKKQKGDKVIYRLSGKELT